ncbi:MAG: PEGA domain-containing protein, partial [Methanoregulaceae archaeon]|nr:PEGA domain-containing protein [Methanoregulaceae archaeon]
MHKKVAFILLLCLVGALSITAASAPVESSIISPSVSAQQTSVPDSLGASDGRAASFQATLEANGYSVNSGQMTPIDPIVDLLDSGIGDSANGNNAGQPYKVLMVPISPFGEEHPLERGLTIFRLRPDEAVVYLGPTPPPCDYFSFTVFLWVRHKDSLVPKGDWMVAAVNDPLNNALIKTEGSGTPFGKQTIVIFTADRGIYENVSALAQEAGYPESMINSYVIPSGLLNLGVFPETPLADSFIILVRTANFASQIEGDLYLSNDHYARVWRVTPETAPALDPFPTPKQRVRTWKSESELYPDLENGLERLKNAIIAQTPHDAYESYESIRWFAESREVLEETDPGSPLYHKFVAGEASDTPYLRTSLSGEAANFTLKNDDMVVVYGVNHAATGLATYSNFGVYGDWITSSCQDDPWQYVFGCGDRSWNGVVSMTSHVFTGSAEEYIPGDPMAPYLYAVKVLRQPPQDKLDKYYVVVPTATPEHPCESPGYCIGLDDPIIIGYRAYLNPATASGADYDDIIHDRAIWFRVRESPGSGSLYVASVPSGATILINGADFGTTNGLVANVPAGSQNLTLTKAGYQPYKTVVTVPANGVKMLASVTLTKSGEVPQEGTGTLYVASVPSGATILMNGTDFGTTNGLVTEVPAGSQNLTLVKEGYQPKTVIVFVPDGGVKMLASVTLTKSGDGEVPPEGTGTLYVSSRPSGATILINGTDFGNTDKFVTGIPAGNQNLTLTKAGYQPYTTMVTIPSGGSKVLTPVTLTK